MERQLEYVLRTVEERNVRFVRLWFTDVVRMFCDIHTPAGEPFDGDPRYVLKRMLEKARERGFTFYVSPEMEYFYFRSSTEPIPLDQASYFDLTPSDEASELRKQTILALESMGIPVQYSHHEIAPSQQE